MIVDSVHPKEQWKSDGLGKYELSSGIIGAGTNVGCTDRVFDVCQKCEVRVPGPGAVITNSDGRGIEQSYGGRMF